MVYDELRELAKRYIAGERAGHPLHPTELVHEAYVRMREIKRIDWKGKTHFFAMAATQMRRVLVDQARTALAAKRGGDRVQVTLGGNLASSPESVLDVIAVDEAMGRLEALDERTHRVAELRLFGGLTVAEVAEALATSERTVKREWLTARAMLGRWLRLDRPRSGRGPN